MVEEPVQHGEAVNQTSKTTMPEEEVEKEREDETAAATKNKQKNLQMRQISKL
jgi:hypothetical protein